MSNSEEHMTCFDNAFANNVGIARSNSLWPVASQPINEAGLTPGAPSF